MPKKTTWAVLIVAALCCYASYSYSEHQAYKTGVYIGKTAFNAADYQNQRCLGLPDDARARCQVRDLNQDSVMEDALASANIIPALVDEPEIYTGFRDGWREARSAALLNR